MTSGALLPAVHVSPKNSKVVGPHGFPAWRSAAYDPGCCDPLVLTVKIRASPGEGPRPCLSWEQHTLSG